MKVTVEFEDSGEAELCLNANKWYCVLWELDQFLRASHKYATPILSATETNGLSEEAKAIKAEVEGEISWALRQKLSQLMSESNISFY